MSSGAEANFGFAEVGKWVPGSGRVAYLPAPPASCGGCGRHVVVGLRRRREARAAVTGCATGSRSAAWRRTRQRRQPSRVCRRPPAPALLEPGSRCDVREARRRRQVGEAALRGCGRARAGAGAVAPAAGRLCGPGREAAARRGQRGRVFWSPGGPQARPLLGLAAPGGNLRLQVPAPAAVLGGTPRGRAAASPRQDRAAAPSGRYGHRRGPGAARPPRFRGAGRREPLGAPACFLRDPFYFRRVGFLSW